MVESSHYGLLKSEICNPKPVVSQFELSEMYLSAAFAEEDDMDGFEEDADFKKGGHVLDVKKVILQFFNGIFY